MTERARSATAIFSTVGLAGILNDKLGDKIKAEVVTGGWPKDSKAAFKNADALVFFCTGGGRHFALKHLDEAGVLGGFDLGLWWDGMSKCLLVGTDERTSQDDIEALANGLASWVREAQP